MSEAGKRDAGTTLVEALVVVAITALAALIAFPALEKIVAQTAFRESTAVVIAELRVAHAAALHRGRPVEFRVSPDGDHFGLNNDLTRGFPEGVTLHAAQGSSVAFYPDGSSSGNEFTLSDGTRETRIHVDPVTGILERAAP